MVVVLDARPKLNLFKMTVSAAQDFAAGLIAGSVGLLVGFPLDTVKFSGLFKGMSIPLLSMGLFNGVLFSVYSRTMKILEPTSKPRSNHWWNMYVAGCIGGGAAVFVICPVENIKVKLQVHKGDHVTYKGPMELVKKILSTGQLRLFYTGFWATFIREFPSSGLYMVSFESLERWLSVDGSHEGALPRSLHNTLATVFSGGIAGVVTWASILPVDVIKSRLQADDSVHGKHRKYSGIRDCIVSTYRSGGVRIFYAGLLAMSVRAFPVNAVTFLLYKTLLRRMDQDAGDQL